MWPNLPFPADLVIFTEEIFNKNFIFCEVKTRQLKFDTVQQK